jgi:hypothetical protein
MRGQKRKGVGKSMNFKPAERKLLGILLDWRYPKDGGKPCKAFHLHIACQLSFSHTNYLLRVLKERGLVAKSISGHFYVIDPKKVKELLIDGHEIPESEE